MEGDITLTDGAYLLPNDEKEQDRLDMMHEMMLTLMDRRLYLAPIATPSCTLDLGTGTGLWAIDFADRFPSEKVIGDESTKGTSIEQYYKVGSEAFAKAGYCVSPGPHLEGWFREIGFEDVHVKKYTIPMGIWPKDQKLKVVGAWNLEEARTGMEASAMAVLTRYDTWAPEEVRILVAKALRDAESRSIHALFDFYVVYGRKP
ncbi:hypothetical protein DTO169C6_3614 [Paecilomyces variotii]|nr:hypothetical protein DTO169C6_3614 [Paecilomyces variotii]